MRFNEKPEQMLESLRERFDKDPEEYDIHTRIDLEIALYKAMRLLNHYAAQASELRETLLDVRSLDQLIDPVLEATEPGKWHKEVNQP